MKVFYKRKYPIGSFLNEDIGFEIEIPDDGDPIDEIHTLKELCDRAHRELNPQMALINSENGPISIPVNGIPTTKKDSKEEAIQSHIKTIEECKTIQNLRIFENLVRNTNHPDLTQAFTDKLNQLQNQ